jgi:hypothetical protein
MTSIVHEKGGGSIACKAGGMIFVSLLRTGPVCYTK